MFLERRHISRDADVVFSIIIIIIICYTFTDQHISAVEAIFRYIFKLLLAESVRCFVNSGLPLPLGSQTVPSLSYQLLRAAAHNN
jgi:hypothetical protein